MARGPRCPPADRSSVPPTTAIKRRRLMMLSLALRFALVLPSAAYMCGTPLSSDYNFVQTEYNTWKGRYLKTMGNNRCCIRRPTNSDDCVSVCSPSFRII